MNIVMISGEIVSDIDFRFIYNREEKAKHISIAKCELQLDDNDSVIDIYGYDEMADYLYRNKGNHICLEGEMDSDLKVQMMSYSDFCEIL